MKFSRIFLIVFCQIISSSLAENIVGDSKSPFPLIVVCWNFTEAAKSGWKVLNEPEKSALDAVEESCKTCQELQCDGTVGYGGSPDEEGETALDAMIMDGVTMDVGAVGNLRGVKNVISVARKVLENTEHTMLVGSLATDFAVEMGFSFESLKTKASRQMWQKWKDNHCQPNYRKNVVPDPKKSCGPYDPIDKELPSQSKAEDLHHQEARPEVNRYNHDTIGVVVMDSNGKIAAGTSTNGSKFKIPGRVGDSPIAGAGAYADQAVGAAACSGDGDIMMRFLPSFLAVEEMRRGASPSEAATKAFERIVDHYPKFSGGIVAMDKHGRYGAACNNLKEFPFVVANPELGEIKTMTVPCILNNYID